MPVIVHVIATTADEAMGVFESVGHDGDEWVLTGPSGSYKPLYVNSPASDDLGVTRAPYDQLLPRDEELRRIRAEFDRETNGPHCCSGYWNGAGMECNAASRYAEAFFGRKLALSV